MVYYYASFACLFAAAVYSNSAHIMVRPVPVCRREADPLMVQKLWTAITFVRSQKQVANTDRIARYLQREYNVTQDEVERQLNFAVTDRLISIYRAIANKGNNPGAEQDGYRIQPADENEVWRVLKFWFNVDDVSYG